MTTINSQTAANTPKILSVAAAFFITYLLGSLLISGRSFLFPIMIALMIWHFFNAIYHGMRQCPGIGAYLPKSMSILLTILIVYLLGSLIGNIITNNVADVMDASSRYQAHIKHLFHRMEEYFHYQPNLKLDAYFSTLSMQPILLAIYGMFTSITSSAVLIALYVAFLFVEQHYFHLKLTALFQTSKNRLLVENILKHIIQDTQAYLGIKTFLSLLAAIASWLVMRFIHLDFAEFWALLIFFLNFIPSIGPMIATAFPAFLALIQFEAIIPCLWVTGSITAIQMIVGNVLEPKYLSRSLNVSPLIILMALAFWGTLWGVLGLFLAVPITVMMMIVFAHFEPTRPLAIVLSQDGCIQKSYATL
jgi:AI-2 transport protein TqsA